MVVLTREQRKQDLHHFMSILDVEPQDNTCKLFMTLTQNGKRQVSAILKDNRSALKEHTATDEDGNTFKFDSWEVSKIINIGRYAEHL